MCVAEYDIAIPNDNIPLAVAVMEYSELTNFTQVFAYSSNMMGRCHQCVLKLIFLVEY